MHSRYLNVISLIINRGECPIKYIPILFIFLNLAVYEAIIETPYSADLVIQVDIYYETFGPKGVHNKDTVCNDMDMIGTSRSGGGSTSLELNLRIKYPTRPHHEFDYLVGKAKELVITILEKFARTQLPPTSFSLFSTPGWTCHSTHSINGGYKYISPEL